MKISEIVEGYIEEPYEDDSGEYLLDVLRDMPSYAEIESYIIAIETAIISGKLDRRSKKEIIADLIDTHKMISEKYGTSFPTCGNIRQLVRKLNM